MKTACVFKGVVKNVSDKTRKILFFQVSEENYLIVNFNAIEGLTTIPVKRTLEGYVDLRKNILLYSWKIDNEIVPVKTESILDIDHEWKYPAENDVFRCLKGRNGYKLLLNPEPWS